MQRGGSVMYVLSYSSFYLNMPGRQMQAVHILDLWRSFKYSYIKQMQSAERC